MDFDDLDPAKLPGVLINSSNRKRDVGYDTISASIGKLAETGVKRAKPEFAMKLSPDDAKGVIEGSTELSIVSQGEAGEQFVPKTFQSNRIEYYLSCWIVSSDAQAGEPNILQPNGSVKFKLRIRFASGRTTEMELKVNRDRNGHYWLTIRANPTALLHGYNAFAVAIPGKGKHAERRMIMRVVFHVLRRFIRSVDKDFDWHPDTKVRINELAFRICPAQVFTYITTKDMNPAELIGFLRCVYSVPYSNKKHHRLLCDDLGIEMHSKVGPDGVETLLLIFRRGGRVAWSVNFYDKLAKATSDAERIDMEVGDESVLRFLRSAIRVDVTIHDGGQREMQCEADINTREEAVLTAANYCRAIKNMDDYRGHSRKRFVHWMLDHIFGDLMKFWDLLGYTPSRLEEAGKKLDEYRADAAAGFIEWYRRGFEFTNDDGLSNGDVSFVTFLTQYAEQTVSRSVARKTREKLLDLKIDPDIPLRAYDAFYNATFIWNLSDKDRHKLAIAQENGDEKTASRLRSRSRRNAIEVNEEIARSFTSMIKSAHTPANSLGIAAKKD